MGIVQIDRKFKNLTVDELSDRIYNIEDSYFIPSNISNLLSKISSDENSKLVLYTIYLILKTNDLLVPGLKYKPKNGTQLRNPDTNQPYGIYHVHLKDGYILIWYSILTDYGLFIEFEFMKHPDLNDNYKTIINDIYSRDDGGFNIAIGKLFVDISNILNEDNNILSTIHIDLYNEFINKYKLR